MSSRTHNWNGYQTTLTTQLNAGASSAQLGTTEGLAAPCYLLIEADVPGSREWVRVNTIVDGTNIGNIVRNQAGSVGDITHPATSVVRGVFTKQQLDGIYTDIESVETTSNTNASTLTDHTTLVDQHPEYILQDGSKDFQGTVGGVSGVATTDFLTKAQVDAGDAANSAAIAQEASDRASADNNHANSNDHPEATTGAKGMLSAADKTKLDGIETDAKDDQDITAGSGLSGGGVGDVTLSHGDTSTQGSVNNANNTVIQDVFLDGFGHVTDINSQTITPSLIGAQSTITNMSTLMKTASRKGTGIVLSTSDLVADSWTVTVPSDWARWQCTARAVICLAGVPAGMQMASFISIGPLVGGLMNNGPSHLSDVKDAGEEAIASVVHTFDAADTNNQVQLQLYARDAQGSGGGTPRYVSWDVVIYRTA